MVKNLTEGNPAKLIFFFAVPLIAGNVCQQLYVFVDTLLVGRVLGMEALAAVGCAGAIMFFLLSFVIGMTTGFSLCTGRYFGAKEYGAVRRSAAACLLLSLAAAVLITLIGLTGVRGVLVYLRTPPEVLEDAYTFIRIILLGSTAPVLLNMLSNLIRSLGDSRTPLYFLIFASALNIALELLFLLHFKWGIAGAAWATVLAQLVAGMLCLLYIYRRIPLLHLRKEDWRLKGSILAEHLRMGLPMSLQGTIISLGILVVQMALNGLGPLPVAAYAAAQKIDMIAIMPMMSFGMAMAAYTAQNYGARRIERIHAGVVRCAFMSVTFSLVIGVINIYFGPALLRLFVGPGETEVVAQGHIYLTISGMNYWILALLFIFRYTLQGLGQSLIPTFAGIMELSMRMIAAMILAQMYGYLGVCYANPMAWASSCFPLLIAYFYTRRSLQQMY